MGTPSCSRAAEELQDRSTTSTTLSAAISLAIDAIAGWLLPSMYCWMKWSTVVLIDSVSALSCASSNRLCWKLINGRPNASRCLV